MPATLLSQATEMFGDKAGYAGAGMLGTFLYWFASKYLPSKDAQLKEFIEGRDRLVRELVEEFRKDLAEISAHVRERDQERRQDFDRALALIAAIHVPPVSHPPAVSPLMARNPPAAERPPVDE